jgi:hypothetical protein
MPASDKKETNTEFTKMGNIGKSFGSSETALTSSSPVLSRAPSLDFTEQVSPVKPSQMMAGDKSFTARTWRSHSIDSSDDDSKSTNSFKIAKGNSFKGNLSSNDADNGGPIVLPELPATFSDVATMVIRTTIAENKASVLAAVASKQSFVKMASASLLVTSKCRLSVAQQSNQFHTGCTDCSARENLWYWSDSGWR